MSHRPSSLKREIVWLLVIKLALLFGIYFLWFNEPLPKHERVDAVSTSVYGSAGRSSDD